MPFNFKIPQDVKALVLQYNSTKAVKNCLTEQQKQWFEEVGTTPYIARWYINHNLDSIDAIHCCNCGVPIIYHKNNQCILYRTKSNKPVERLLLEFTNVHFVPLVNGSLCSPLPLIYFLCF